MNVRVRVPATSANLGPGFDCLGVAWQLYNVMEFSPGKEGLRISGCPERCANRENLAYQGYRAVLAAAGLPEEALEIDFLESDIPISRGLGSSAALIAGGVLAADALHGLHLSRREMLAIAAKIEGHPDNAAPALLGGLTAAAMEDGRPVTAAYSVHPSWRFAALIPDSPLPTRQARQALPERVSREDAVFNLSRTALLLRAIENGDGEMLRFAMEDRLHQPYRFPLIPGSAATLALAKDSGIAALCISGAGSTLLCVAQDAEAIPRLQSVLLSALPAWRCVPLQVDGQGAMII